ncbi:MAG TPA: DUF547 domain-containing protein [Thermoanaerobaculia bacterium]|nr:DUF547 domain-containing protein [Thermoanaerobaculia bacterium]
MTRPLRSLSLLLALIAGARLPAAAAAPGAAGEPDYAEWNRLLAGYYDPAHGMDYRGLRAKESAALQRLRQALATVDVGQLARQQQLAYWLNLYNVNTVGVVVDHYPVASIRDLSTDPLVRLNVFSKDNVDTRRGKVSLNDIENDEVREGFHDPRVHFALNCAARSCPPLRTEAYVGARVDEQLDDQVRRFFAGPGARVEGRGKGAVIHVTKILDWFEKDFKRWGGGVVPFLRRYLPAEKLRLLPPGDDVDLDYDDYDWQLNDWHR